LGGLLHRQHERRGKDKHMKITVEYFVQKKVEKKEDTLKSSCSIFVYGEFVKKYFNFRVIREE